jgi:hypothetical protein
MTPERWRQIEDLYHAARADRAVLENADPEIRGEVEKLLAQPSGGALLDHPAADLLPESTVTLLGIGAQLGQYKIEELIGQGGMGQVYRARDTKLNRPVAVKFLSDELADAVVLRGIRPDGAPADLPPLQGSAVFRFTPDGKALIYASGTLRVNDFWMLDLATKKTRQLTRLTNTASRRTFDITPDGKQIVFDRLRDNSDIVLIDLPERGK